MVCCNQLRSHGVSIILVITSKQQSARLRFLSTIQPERKFPNERNSSCYSRMEMGLGPNSSVGRWHTWHTRPESNHYADTGGLASPSFAATPTRGSNPESDSNPN